MGKNIFNKTVITALGGKGAIIEVSKKTYKIPTAKSKRNLRSSLEEYVLQNGKKVYILGEGRLINLAAADGHPAEVMDMSFANQALAVEYFLKNKGKLKNIVHVLPKQLDQEVALLKLASMGISIDKLTKEQSAYLSSWTEGTK